MSTHSLLKDIDSLDVDGALRETAHDAGAPHAISRRHVLAGAGAGVAAGTLAAFAPAASAKASSSDISILNFALTLEYLEAAFYAEANRRGALSGETARFAKVVAGHEATHVKTITAVIKSLGAKPVAKPAFDFRDTTAKQSIFQQTSLALESTGVAAYLGQGAYVKSDTILGKAVAILAVEARHQAWIADIIGGGTKPSPSPRAFAVPKTKAQVLAAVRATGFIKAEHGPRFTG